MLPKNPARQRSLELIDIQAGGDVSRIVLEGVKALPGDSVHAQQEYLKTQGDQADGQRGWDTRITSRAWALARSHIVIDLDDPLIDNRDLENILVDSVTG